MADNDLFRLEEWFGAILHGLSPAERRKAIRKIGDGIRRSNSERMFRNVTPDGSPMEPRKPRKLPRKLRKKSGSTFRGKMFQSLRKKHYWRVDGDDEGVTISPYNPVINRIASISQFGEVAPVGRLRVNGRSDGRLIFAKFPQRQLLGFSDEDKDLALQIAADLLEPKGF